MAVLGRYLLTKSVYIDPPGPGRLRAGQWVALDAISMQPGDVLWLNGDPNKSPTGGVSTISGVDSVDG